jgi:hypothetical protein
VNGGHSFQIFVDGAYQDLAPETADGMGRLAFLQQPVEHADAVEIFAAGAFAAHGHEGFDDADFVLPAEAMEAQERAGEVERRGEASALEDGYPAAGLQEIEFAVELNAVADA